MHTHVYTHICTCIDVEGEDIHVHVGLPVLVWLKPYMWDKNNFCIYQVLVVIVIIFCVP